MSEFANHSLLIKTDHCGWLDIFPYGSHLKLGKFLEPLEAVSGEGAY